MVSLWTLSNKDSGPQFGETIYISEINGASKVKSNAQVAINKNSYPCRIYFLGVSGEDRAPNSNFSKLLELSKTSWSSKLMFGLHVNIDKGNSRRYD